MAGGALKSLQALDTGPRVDKLPRLKPKQQRFVEEYIVDFNASAAAIRSGYSIRNAGTIGHDLFHRPKIAAHIKAQLAERSRRTGITADRVLQELARLALVNPPDVIDALVATIKDGASRDDTAAIQSIKCKIIPQKGEDADPIIEREIRIHDKTKPLELLMRHLGMGITEKREHSGPGGGPIAVQSRVTLLSQAELDALVRQAAQGLPEEVQPDGNAGP